MKKIKFMFFAILFLFVTQIAKAGTTCNWMSRTPYFLTWDSCGSKSSKNQGMLNGYIAFNYSKSSCLKYQWTVNGNNVTTNRAMTFMPTANGKYSVCVKVTDTCSGCDTTFCSSMGISCIGSTTTSKCNWGSRNPYFFTWDSCGSSNAKNKGMIYGYIAFNYVKSSCFKYQWTVNGNNITTNRPMTYMPSANGKYLVCVKVTDTCSGCDTTFCSYMGITCLGSNTSSSCNWQSRIPYFLHWDSCGTKGANNGKIYGYIYFNYAKMGCFKYQWTVNGNNITTSRALSYMPTANGKYSVCVKVTDTCMACDTTFCYSFGITCIGTSTSKCDWKSRNAYFFTWDSCGAKISSHKSMINGYIAFNYAKSGCFKYQWTVNGNRIATTRPLQCWATANGTYSVCLKVTDTCLGCDTTYCGSVTINCLGNTTSKCDWQSRKPYFIMRDSCGASSANKGKIYGYIYFAYAKSGCFKYQWTVNNTNITTTRPMEFSPKYNGTYNVCVKVTDTCSGCDTTFCKTMTIACLGTNSSGCNWKSRNPYFLTWDSCNSLNKTEKLIGYIGFNYAKSSCFKFQWTINDTIVSDLRYFNYQVYANGTYKMCVKVMDTCNNCDTLFCSSLTVKCFSTAGIRSIQSNLIYLSPNPTSGIINVAGSNASAYYTVRNLNGSILKTGVLSDDKIDISNFDQGIYVLSIKNDGNWIHSKIIKN